MRSLIVALFWCVCLFGDIASCQSAGSDDDFSKHPAREWSAATFREFITTAVSENSELRTFLPDADWNSELPVALDLYFPVAPPGVYISHDRYEPFAMLGPWKIFFATDGCDTCVDSVVLPRRLYRPSDAGSEIDCRDLVLVPVQRGADTTKPLELQGWYVEEYVLHDRLFYARGIGMRCVAAGGAFNAKAGTSQNDSVHEVAFFGHVERMIEPRKGSGDDGAPKAEPNKTVEPTSGSAPHNPGGSTAN